MRLILLIFFLSSTFLFSQEAGVEPIPQPVEKNDVDGKAGEKALQETLKKIEETTAAAAKFFDQRIAVPADLEGVKRQMESMEGESAKKAPMISDLASKSLDEMEELAAAAESTSGANKAKLKALVAESERRKRQLDRIPDLQNANTENLESVLEQLESESLTDLEKRTLEAQKRLLDETAILLEEEKKFYREASDLLTKRRDLALRQSEASAKQAAAVQRLVDTQRLKIARRAETEAQVVAEHTDLPKELMPYANENTDIARIRKELASLIALANEDLTAARRELVRIDRDHADAVQQVNLVESAGVRLGQRTGELLREEKHNLPRVDETQDLVRSGVERLTESRLKKVEREKERRDELSDIDGEVKRLSAKVDQEDLDEEEVLALEKRVRALVNARRELLEALIGDYGTYTETLSETLSARRDTIRKVRENSDFIERRLLWISSAPALHASDFSNAVDGVRSIFLLGKWKGLAGRLVTDLVTNFHIWAVFIVILAWSLWRRSRHKVKLTEVGEIAAKRNCRKYLPSFQALFYTVAIALPIPLVIGFLWWRTSGLVGAGPWVEAISKSFKEICFPATALVLARGLCRSRGLLQCHLGLDSKKAVLLFRAFTVTMLLIIPLVFLREALANFDFRPGSRICFIVSMLVIAGFAVVVLRPSVGLVGGGKKSLWCSCAYPVYLTILGLSIGFAAATYLGYYYTVGELSWRVRFSVWMILTVLFVAAFVMRLLIVSRRRVAFNQKLAAFRAQAAERAKVENEGEAVDTAAPNFAEIEADLVDITKVKAQTQSLIRMSATIAIIVLLWGVWVEVAPSLKVFDAIPVWSTAEAAPAASEGGNVATGFIDTATGGSKPESEAVGLEKIVPKDDAKPFVSLADVGLAIFTLFLTYFAASNIPGLLEITLLQRLRLKPGGSYTVTTVVRYVIVLVGIITAFAYVDITWGKVQWIAAAITLGVGFGLQEVFANFVAGLILLFERPIRLGDFVTVGGVNGTVTQIRIRATTIRDRGNKELLVPNKEFITGQLINWTLTDVVIRIEVPVGIAYGSDTELARKLLLEVAADHKIVLKDPPPAVVFGAFGASSLDFELRVFIRGADDIVRAGSELHFAVDKVFREHGIEIAFPQTDLHVRSLPEGMKIGGDEDSNL